MGVAVHRSRLYVQLGNTSSTNKNNIVLRFLMKLVRDSVVLSAEADFLRVGHTHEDIDQFIGQLCSWIHHQPVAQTPQDFVRHSQGFLNTLTKKPWPQAARARRCVYINQGRDWKTWLEGMPGLKNHTGPGAPHVFRFQCRGSCAPGLLARMRCVEFVGPTPSHNDVVLFCKRWMADGVLSQRPLVVLPAAYVPRGQPPTRQTRAAITPKLANHLLKYSARLAEQPYNLTSGARYITDWVHRRLPWEPPLDVTGVLEPAPLVGTAVVAVRPAPDVPAAGGTDVALADAGAVDDDADMGPSARAVVLYGVVVDLHVHHNVPWPDALAAGERAFHGGARRAAPARGARKRRKLQHPAEDAGPGPDLALQPLDLVLRG